MYYLNIFVGLTKPPASDIWWQMENIWWPTPPNHLICRPLVCIYTSGNDDIPILSPGTTVLLYSIHNILFMLYSI